MGDIERDDEVGWREDGEDGERYVGFVISEPNDMGEFYVNVEDEAGHAQTRVLDALALPKDFINYTKSTLVEPVKTPKNKPIVISKPQKQSLWPYLAFMVAGGALILNI
jgi:hypothetical protein